MIKAYLKPFLVSLSLVLAVSFAGRALAYESNLYDVSGTVYEDSFAYLQRSGAVQGYPDGYGRPDSPLNRVEALKVILAVQQSYNDRIAWYTDHMPPIPLFTDVDQRAWYGPYLEVAFQEGIVTGYPNGTFKPSRVLSVEEAVTMLMRTFGESGSFDHASLSAAIQNRDAEWFTPYINAAVDKNLIMHNRGTLRLGTAITRGQFFDMVYRLSVVREQGIVAYNGPEPQAQTTVVAQPYNGLGVQSVDGILDLPGGPTTVDTVAFNDPLPSEQYFAISMPTLGIQDLVVTHPLDATDKQAILDPLQYGVGHLFGYPGGGGKIMIYGHSSGYPWDVSEYTKIFRRVNELKTGDKIYVTYAGDLFVYEVVQEQTIAAADTTPFQDGGGGEELILYTCWPPDSITQRYLVHAVPVTGVAAQ